MMNAVDLSAETRSEEDSKQRDRPTTITRVTRLTPRQKEQVLSFIDERLDEHVAIADLAKLIGYSSNYFWHRFKTTFQQAPYQFILSRRIERAKEMLSATTLPIAGIALACGFANQAHLTRVFKQRTGHTPRRYRRKHPPE